MRSYIKRSYDNARILENQDKIKDEIQSRSHNSITKIPKGKIKVFRIQNFSYTTIQYHIRYDNNLNILKARDINKIYIITIVKLYT